MSETIASVTSRIPSRLLSRLLFCFVALLPLFFLIGREDRIFHAVLEIAIITVGVVIFSIGWHAYTISRNDSLLLLSVGFLIVSAFDLLHTLSYGGMLPQAGLNLSSQLWTASGLVEGISLLLAAALAGRRLRLTPFLLLSAWIVAGALFIAAIVPLDLFPPFYRPGVGHMPFQTGAQGLNLLLLVLAAVLFYLRRRNFPPMTAFLLIFAAGLQFLSVANLFLRIDVAAFSGFFGHISRFLGHVLVYAALIQGALLTPFASLFGNLSASERNLRHALAEAETTRDNIDTILRSIEDGMVVADTEHRVLLLNAAAERLLGITAAEILNRSLPGALREPALQAHLVAAAEGQPAPVEIGRAGSDPSKPRIIQARSSPVQGRDGRRTGTVTIFQDVTRERKIDLMKSEFISTAAHELRTPLTSIQGFSELLLNRSDIPTGDQTTFLTYIHDQAEVLTRIVHDLLDIARIEAGRDLALNRDICPVRSCLRQIEPFLRSASDRHRFEVALMNEDVKLLVDRGKIQQVLENLLSNAVKYSPGGGTIRVCGSLEGRRYRIEVSDEGIGMTPEQVERIFDKFYRADSANAAISGIGLGMSIVRSIIEAHGETIRVQSAPGQGTTVIFTLPLAGEEAIAG